MAEVRNVNPFALLGDDASDSDDIKGASPAVTKSAPKEAVKAENNVKTTDKKADGRKDVQGGRGGSSGRGRGTGRDARPASEPVSDEKESRTKEKRGGARGQFSGRGRQYDRHSGSGMRDSEKKEVAGKGTWGAPGSELQEGVEKLVLEEGQQSDAGSEAQEEQAPKEPEPVLLTLEQYKASLKRAQPAAVPSRHANEGVDDKQWANTKAFERKDDTEALFAGKQQQKNLKKKERPQKEFIEVEVRFMESSSSSAPRGGFRGGRGRGDGTRGRGDGTRGRGGRGRGAPRGGRSNGPAIDMSAFPELSK